MLKLLLWALCVVKKAAVVTLREDYAKRDDANFLNHTVITLKEDGEYEVGQSEVVITRFEPKERTY